MTEEDEARSSWTLGNIRSAGLVLEGACATEGCNRFVLFDLEALIARFGADWCVPLTLPVSCSACGAPLKFQLAAMHGDAPREGT